MYLRRVHIRNIKCFDSLELQFVDVDSARRWTALLGRNGLGKSTLLQAIAVALAGPGATRELLPVAEGWVRNSEAFGEIEAELDWTDGDAQEKGWPKKTPYRCRFAVTGSDPEKLPEEFRDTWPTVPSIVDYHPVGTSSKEKEQISKSMNRLRRTAYAEGKVGWLACGYGPFRRLSGGSQDADRILYAGRKAARFVTLFREDAALTSATEWLIGLHNTSREGDAASQHALDVVRRIFVEQLMPNATELVVDARSAGLKFQTGEQIPFGRLSDGYRSMLALAIDLVRWVLTAYPATENPLACPGVVLIDELDAHLHPLWQQRIGDWLLEKFPNLQFIVATHSPFLAQVAKTSRGNVILEKGARDTVELRDDLASVNAWRADQVLTELFGLSSTRSPEGERTLASYLRLQEEARLRKLTAEEDAKRKQLELQLGDSVPDVTDPDHRHLLAALKTAIRDHRDELAKAK